MLLLSVAFAHGPICNDWAECLGDLQSGDAAHLADRADWLRAAKRVCDLDDLEACAFAAIVDPASAYDTGAKVAELREQACRDGVVRWCRHAVSGAMYVRVGDQHAVFDGGSPRWLSMPDQKLADCNGNSCMPALAWSLERTHRLCKDLGCTRSAADLKTRACLNGLQLACTAPHKKHAKRCDKGDAAACLELAVTAATPEDFANALARSVELGDSRATTLSSLFQD